MSVINLSVRGIGALPGSYPIVVEPGKRVRVSEVQFTYSGPPKTLWVCWGLKKKGWSVNFNNGDGLVGGKYGFASSSITASEGVNVPITRYVDAQLFIPVDLDGTYDVFVWISTQSSADESKILAIDTDAGVIKVQKAYPPLSSVSEMDAGYQVV